MLLLLGELVLVHDELELLSQADALVPVGVILDEDLVDLSHFDTPFDLVDFRVTTVELTTLLSDRSFVTGNQLLG